MPPYEELMEMAVKGADGWESLSLHRPDLSFSTVQELYACQSGFLPSKLRESISKW